MISIKNNVDKFINGSIKEVKQAVVKAETRANRRVATTVIKEFTNEVQKDYAIKDAGIKKDLRVSRGRNEDGTRGAGAIITARGKRGIALSRFLTRQTKKGVSFIVSRTKGRKVIPGAFIAKMKSKHIGVYVRKGKTRLPIDQKFGPDVKMLINTERMMKLHKEVINKTYPAYFRQELRYQLKKGMMK